MHYLDDPAKTLRTFHTAKYSNKTKVQNNNTPDQSNRNRPTISTNNDIQNNNSKDVQRNPSTASHSNTKQRTAKQLPLIKKNDNQPYTKMNLQNTNTTNNNDDDESTLSRSSSFSTRNNTSYNKNLNTLQRNELENRSDKDENKDEEDITIDPRAKVMFSIGNNIFQIDNKQTLGKKNFRNQSEYNYHHSHQQQSSKKSQWSKRKSINDKENKKLDETFNLSIKELLQELGVHDTNSNNDNRQSNDQHQHINIPKKNEINHNLIPDHQIDDQPTLYMQLQQNYISGRQVDNNPPSSAYNYISARQVQNNNPPPAIPYNYNQEYIYSTEMVTPPNDNNFNDNNITWGNGKTKKDNYY